MSNITVKVEFLAGTQIEDAILEAKQKAALWDVAYVEFDFNRVSFCIGKNADVLTALEAFKSARKDGGSVVYS